MESEGGLLEAFGILSNDERINDRLQIATEDTW